MAEKTTIEWVHQINPDGSVTPGSTVSFWWGCEKWSPGCKSCYAKPIADRFGGDIWGKTKPRLYQPNAAKTLRALNRKAEKSGAPRLVFVNSMSDFFEEHDGRIVDSEATVIWQCATCGHRIKTSVDPSCRKSGCKADYRLMTLDDLRREAFQVIDECQWLRFLLLTKRPENIRKMWVGWLHDDMTNGAVPMPRDNVWIGCSVENQQYADSRIPELLKCRDLAPVLWVSYEPALGPVDFSTTCMTPSRETMGLDGPYMPDGHAGIDWVIAGSESGPGRRPADIEWFRSVRDQCAASGVAFFCKQMEVDGKISGDIESFPADLRVRQYPQTQEPAHAD